VNVTNTAPYLIASANRRAIDRLSVGNRCCVVWRRELMASENVVAVRQKQDEILGHTKPDAGLRRVVWGLSAAAALPLGARSTTRWP